jgi:hypothetical protein
MFATKEKMEKTEAEKEYERRRREDDIKIAKAIVGAIGNLFTRQRKIDDPCLRNCLFVDKLSCILDIAMSTLQCQIDDEWPEDLKLKIFTLSKEINQSRPRKPHDMGQKSNIFSGRTFRSAHDEIFRILRRCRKKRPIIYIMEWYNIVCHSIFGMNGISCMKWYKLYEMVYKNDSTIA